MDFTRIIGGFIKLLGNSDGTLIGNVEDALKTNLRDSSGNEVGTGSNPLIVNSTGSVGRTSVNQFNESLAVASGASTTLVQYTVPTSSSFMLERISVSGENIALFTITVNSVTVDTQRTYFGGALNCEFNFISSGNQGYPLNIGDIVLVTVLHNRPDPGNFEGRIQMSMTT